VRVSRRRGQLGQDPVGRWGGRSFPAFFSGAADALTAKLDPSCTSEDGREFAATPLGIEGAMRQGVLIDEAIEVLFQLARDLRRSPRARPIDQALDPLAGKTMDPLAESGRGKGEGVRDGLQTLSFHDVAHGLGTAEDAGFCGLLYEGV
jgi:hypothetical protein